MLGLEATAKYPSEHKALAKLFSICGFFMSTVRSDPVAVQALGRSYSSQMSSAMGLGTQHQLHGFRKESSPWGNGLFLRWV